MSNPCINILLLDPLLQFPICVLFSAHIKISSNLISFSNHYHYHYYLRLKTKYNPILNYIFAKILTINIVYLSIIINCLQKFSFFNLHNLMIFIILIFKFIPHTIILTTTPVITLQSNIIFRWHHIFNIRTTCN